MVESQQTSIKKKRRDSNLELYRIIAMLMIVAHHYVVNSPLIFLLRDSEPTLSSGIMLIFGAWGKTGINCFMLITGYFICRMDFNFHKFIKLYLQVVFYGVLIYAGFLLTGLDEFSFTAAVKTVFPFSSIQQNFVGCFLIFYLFIPFLNILIKNLNKKQHALLTVLLLFIYTVLPTMPLFKISMNYVSWFAVLYFMASFIRLHGMPLKISTASWGWITLGLILIASISILGFSGIYKYHYYSGFAPYWFVADSNKILAVFIAVSSFMFFKGLDIRYNQLINSIASTTFGVLLIHTNSETMRQLLWGKFFDAKGHFSADVISTLGHAAGAVILVFGVCSLIDWLRIKFIESGLENGSKKVLKKLNISV